MDERRKPVLGVALTAVGEKLASGPRLPRNRCNSCAVLRLRPPLLPFPGQVLPGAPAPSLLAAVQNRAGAFSPTDSSLRGPAIAPHRGAPHLPRLVAAG